MMMGPEPRIRIFEMSVRFGIGYAILFLVSGGAASLVLKGSFFSEPENSRSSKELSSRAKRGICSSALAPQYSAKSCHVGFVDLIRASRFARVHAFTCFSRAMAFPMCSNVSQYTKRLILYFFVNPSILPL